MKKLLALTLILVACAPTVPPPEKPKKIQVLWENRMPPLVMGNYVYVNGFAFKVMPYELFYIETMPDSVYHIQVSAFNNNGESPRSQEVIWPEPECTVPEPVADPNFDPALWEKRPDNNLQVWINDQPANWNPLNDRHLYFLDLTAGTYSLSFKDNYYQDNSGEFIGRAIGQTVCLDFVVSSKGESTVLQFPEDVKIYIFGTVEFWTTDPRGLRADAGNSMKF